MKASMTRVMSIVMRLTAMPGVKNKHERPSKSNTSQKGSQDLRERKEMLSTLILHRLDHCSLDADGLFTLSPVSRVIDSITLAHDMLKGYTICQVRLTISVTLVSGTLQTARKLTGVL